MSSNGCQWIYVVDQINIFSGKRTKLFRHVHTKRYTNSVHNLIIVITIYLQHLCFLPVYSTWYMVPSQLGKYVTGNIKALKQKHSRSVFASTKKKNYYLFNIECILEFKRFKIIFKTKK